MVIPYAISMGFVCFGSRSANPGIRASEYYPHTPYINSEKKFRGDHIMFQKASYKNPKQLSSVIDTALGREKADLVLKNVAFLDVFTGSFVEGDIAIYGGYIVGICDSYQGIEERDCKGLHLVPGFIDAHVHIESSLMTPARYEESVLPLGTTSAIWDPHEIANVKGCDGIKWAIESSEKLLMDVFVMLPGCVPSTSRDQGLESGGAEIVARDLLQFKDHPRVLGLAEMMNYPGLLNGDEDIHAKVHMFSQARRDGHCPGLTGHQLNAYAAAGIHSCHETVTKSEALEKLMKGIHTLIREGSCAKNADTLLPLINSYTSSVLALCSDDRNPADISSEGHMDFIINLALKASCRPEDIFRVASYSAAKMYGLEDRGAIAPGYQADLCLIKKNADNWDAGFKMVDVFKKGKVVSKELAHHTRVPDLSLRGNNIHTPEITAKSFHIGEGQPGPAQARVIKVLENQIVTEEMRVEIKVSKKGVECDPGKDILKIAVIERHQGTGQIGVGLVHGFGLQSGAIATSINHDSHNVIVVGVDDESMAAAVEALREINGGIVVWQDAQNISCLPLPIGGLMTDESPKIIASRLKYLKNSAKSLGCRLHEPFLQLSFLALPVIPSLKITDKGLVDVNKFQVVSTLCE